MGFSICFFSFEGGWGEGESFHDIMSWLPGQLSFLSAMALCVGGAQNISNYFHFFLLLKVGSVLSIFLLYSSLSTFVERQRSWRRELRRGR
jgi:hypothetical protein